MSIWIKTSALIVVSILLSLFIAPASAYGAIEKNNTFSNQYKLFNQKLDVSIPPSLYAYYSNMTHTIPNDLSYAKLVTPKTVQPIADSILEITRNMPKRDEQFANAVLALIHQIPYSITGSKYPVETLAENVGDCGGLSLLAASIMKAGGLDVVLIKYTGINPGHVNVGVYLPYTPIYHSLLMSTTSFEYNNKTYWTAEATSQRDWKVGDQSNMLENAKHTIIPLDNSEEISPGQVSSSITTLIMSSITINVSQQPSNTQETKRAIAISGSIQPATPNSSVTIYINENRAYKNYFETVTDSSGKYALTWNITSDGTYYITSSWNGNTTYAGADSETLTIFIGPEPLAQFQTTIYNYIIGKQIADVAIRPFVGVDDFLSIPLGTNVSLSYDFNVLQTGSAGSDIQTEEVIIPSKEYTIRFSNRQTKTIEIPSRTILVPMNIPKGLVPLRLSDDFNQTINSKFCFIVRDNLNSSYSLEVKAFNDYEMKNIKLENEGSTFLLNATQEIQEGNWYTVTTAISDDGIIANLQRENGDPIVIRSDSYKSKNSTQLVLLIANNVGSAVVLKDLKVQAVNNPLPPDDNNKQIPNDTISSSLYIKIIIILTVIFAAAVIYVKKKSKQVPTLVKEQTKNPIY